MKELTTEEKAKAYDKVIEKLRDFYRDYDTVSHLIDVREELANLFPELMESDDERIRKALIDMFSSNKKKDWRSIPTEKIITWLEKQGEQKAADNVEAKFKVGDWVVYNKDVCQIVKREEGCNKLVTVFGIEKELVNERNLSTARLWSIKDAKDGDVLVMQKTDVTYESIFIFKKTENSCIIQYLHYFTTDTGEEVCKARSIDGFLGFVGTIVHPATKEQRELLLQKMKESGYEFDFEKKELKKIEQPKLTEFEDAIKGMIDVYRDAIDVNDATVEEVKKHAAYLLSLIPQKLTWSEEDEKNLQGVIDEIEANKSEAPSYDVETYDRFLSWLKSLKQRIGG